MAIHYRTQGFVLKQEDLGEADCLFTVFTKDFGRLEVLGKAIRKIKSKLRGAIGLFYLSEIEFIQGKTYKILTDTILIENFQNIKKNLGRLKIAYQIAEISDRFLKGEEKDLKIWKLLKEIFNWLNSEKLLVSQYLLLYYFFLWNFLSILGYHPQLSNCSLCQKKIISKNFYFSSKEGGIICPVCFKRSTDLRWIKKINSEVVKIIRLIFKKDWSAVCRLKIKAANQNLLKIISNNYLNFLLTLQ